LDISRRGSSAIEAKWTRACGRCRRLSRAWSAEGSDLAHVICGLLRCPFSWEDQFGYVGFGLLGASIGPAAAIVKGTTRKEHSCSLATADDVGTTIMTRDPAANIHELVDFLKKEHRPGYLYRGQNKDYPVMVPSMYRPLVIDLGDSSPIARVDPKRFQAASHDNSRTQWRNDMLLAVLQQAGLGLGNVIAQQYGLTSEAIDVTESIDVASFFATRNYPGYYHIETGGNGVIYRFHVREHLNLRAPYKLSQLTDYFEYGKSDDGFFELFVKMNEKRNVFQRDQWWVVDEGRSSIVDTLSFSTSWTDMQEAIAAHGKFPSAKGFMYIADALSDMDWRRTRFASQHGGFLRPSYFWSSRVPSRFRLAHNWEELESLRGGKAFGSESEFGLIEAWPLVVPSAALKEELQGIENVRARADCEPFLFKHSEKRVGGLYRRFLWPEPSEDPLYGALWNLAIMKGMSHHSPVAPAIDDPQQGVLDRGYQVANEGRTRDARVLDDLMRGQLEDALDGIASDVNTIFHQSRHAFALQALGRQTDALQSLMKGLRLDPDNFELLLGLAELFKLRAKQLWRAKAIEKAYRLAPDEPVALQAIAYLRMDQGDLDAAADYLDEALAKLDEAVHRRSRDDLLSVRAVLAGARAEDEHFRVLSHYLRGQFFDIEAIKESAKRLRKRTRAIAAGKSWRIPDVP
jgi:tetratricopeptide (TPR) repeat protein